MKFIRITPNGIYEFDSSFGLEKEDVINIAKTAIEQGLIDPRDIANRIPNILRTDYGRENEMKEDEERNVVSRAEVYTQPTTRTTHSGVAADPFYCMKSKATNFFKHLKEVFGNIAFDSDSQILRDAIQKFYFPRWSDSLKILKDRGYATYEKNEKGRIVNIRLLF